MTRKKVPRKRADRTPGGPPPWVRAVLREPATRRVVLAWRRLTTTDRSRRAGPGAGTLIACSGGADSSALALAIGAALWPGRGVPLVVMHVVHDLRPRGEAEADRDRARELAELIGAEFVEARVRVRGSGGNLEAMARRERYGVLEAEARRRGLGFVATAHHADDQLETLVMAMLRGAGPRGMSGVRESRRLGEGGVRVIRPMVAAGVDRAACERVCQAAAWVWAVDATNADVSRLRSAVRHRVVPVVKELKASAAARACATARVMGEADRLMRRAARVVWKRSESTAAGGREWDRTYLRRCDAIVLGELLRLAAQELADSRRADRMSERTVAAAVRAIRDESTEPRRLVVGPLRVDVAARRVTIGGRSKL